MKLIQYWLNQGEINAAKTLLITMIKEDPNYLEAVECLAHIYDYEGETSKAIGLLLNVADSPNCTFSIKFNLGDLYLKQGAYKEAIFYYKLALESTEPFFEVLHNLGLAHAQLFQFKEAKQYFEKANFINHHSYELQLNWGSTLKNLGEFKESLTHLGLAENINPMDACVWLNKGVTLEAMDRQQEALECYDKAIALNHNYLEAHCNKANSLMVTGQYSDAMESFKSALAINPNDHDTLYNLSLLQLAMGDFVSGWKNYENRWLRENAPQKLFRQRPELTDLGNIQNKKILVWSEQGLGDSIQFSRYLIPLINSGAVITLATQPQLINLFKSIGQINEVLSINEVEESKYDFQIPLLSLPFLFHQADLTPSVKFPYLHSDPIKTSFWQDRLKNIQGLKIGLVWSGGFRADQPEVWATNARRNIPLADLAKISDIPGIRFFSLQKGEPAESELIKAQAALWPQKNLSIFTSELNTFEDTASLIENLDLVISVDTSTAHLAGALGKPLWILNRFDGCWRWLIQQEKTHWYPQARIFNQSSQRDWDGVMNQVKNELIALAALKQTKHD
jgi:tetratricopeptide (TPR) repeat protein